MSSAAQPAEAPQPSETSDRRRWRWPSHLFGGRIRTSTLVLVVAFVAVWWLYDSYREEQAPPPAPQVVPPGFIPDPAYTWVPRTRLQQPPVTITKTVTPTPTTTTEAPVPAELPPSEPPAPTPVPGFPFCPPLCPPAPVSPEPVEPGPPVPPSTAPPVAPENPAPPGPAIPASPPGPVAPQG